VVDDLADRDRSLNLGVDVQRLVDAAVEPVDVPADAPALELLGPWVRAEVDQ
jgi:hypothetical protein